MIISKNPAINGYQIKTKNDLVTIDASAVKINNYLINQPGEYDVSGVTVNASNIQEEIKAILGLENFFIAVLGSKHLEDQLSEEFNKVSILLLLLQTEADIKKAENVVAQTEPRLVFYSAGPGVNLSQIPALEVISGNYKVSQNDLNFDGTRHLSFANGDQTDRTE